MDPLTEYLYSQLIVVASAFGLGVLVGLAIMHWHTMKILKTRLHKPAVDRETRLGHQESIAN